jgi:hypothetical protein
MELTMPTNRTPINPSIKYRITPELVAKFVVAREIMDADDHESWEERGGRRREYLEMWSAIQMAFNIAPWETSPLDINPHVQPKPHEISNNWKDYHTAKEIRLALDEAAERMMQRA